MNHSEPQTEAAVEMIRLFFPLPEEEKVAVDLVRFFGARANNQLVELRPDTNMDEVLELARCENWNTAEFSYMLELAGLDAFDDELEQMTFREFVQYSACKKKEFAEKNEGAEDL